MSKADSYLLGAGRQYGPTLGDIKANHRLRYEWARGCICGETVIDAGCGIGYGSSILARGGSAVTGLEFNPGVVEEAQRLWSHPKLKFLQWDLCGSNAALPEHSVVVAFEVIEHLVMPERFLCSVDSGSTLIGSVPSSVCSPHTILVNPFHIRHYTYGQVEELLDLSGYRPIYWGHQDDHTSEVTEGRKDEAKTLIFKAVRTRSAQVPSTEEYASRVLRELLRRANVINDLKNGNRKPRAETAF